MSAELEIQSPPASWPFADGAEQMSAYVRWLAGPGVERGLIGPRETARIWERHILNCAVVETAVPRGSVVVDVGSGAGLPGIVLALVRPDLVVHLVEPMGRRSQFLTEVVEDLGVDARIVVHRGRAQDVVGEVVGDVVTARALVSLDRLVPMCVPLMRRGGQILAVKGARAAAEVEAARRVLARHGFGDPEIVRCGEGIVSPPTTLVRLIRRPEPVN